MKAFEEVSRRLHAIYRQALADSNRARYDEELWRYYGHLATLPGCLKQTRYVYDLCRLAHFDPEGKVILDAGCGFGALAIILGLMGAHQVHGVDISPTRLPTFQQMIEDFQLSPPLNAHFASAERLDFPAASFDMILSNEAISHYHDVDAFLAEAARLLKPGGVLLIADGNNAVNPRLAAHTRELWLRFENGPAGPFDGHRVKKPYVEMRAEIIQEAFPQLDESQVQELARRTSRMTREQILQAVQSYLETGVLPDSIYAPVECPVNPLTGAVLERLFHPAQLAKQIERFGFRASHYAYLGGAGGNPLVRLANTLGMALTPLTLRWARSFRIVAVRTG
ncbi:2-methyl-6-phytyl-1,4-hydroquinone methyltransferase [bacterium HR15]|uniref:Biotin biosynthesis related protein n=1 Tax=uncultured prokaryote TaxID=198431 RepID=H5SN81_9ZZZZ|nr:biotin biosynthesis related protein [uncultured prokaryote]GBC91664.1 2-methyl-6-phytyl-1,4-hydroquinone methyltransferase [bacterium HR15]